MVLMERVQNYLVLSGEILNIRRILVQERDDLIFNNFEISVAYSDVVQWV